MFSIKRLFKHTLWALMSLFITGCVIAGIIIIYFELQLPDIDVLKDIRLQTPLQIYSSDGKLMAEYGEKRRKPVSLDQVPKQLIQAILATEDQRYFEHPGIDPIGLFRAARELIITGTKSQGGSTITMQVARNFFLSRKKTFSRKIKEVLLAMKIDSEFSKEKILELYLNKIYLGNRAYGVAAAAQVYYGKPLEELSLAQMAMLAGLPKAPSALNPIANPAAAKDRRDHVLQRMYEKGYITQAQYDQAVQAPVTATYHDEAIELRAPYAAEAARDAVLNAYGDKAYTDGLKIYTTINSNDQQAANQAVRNALIVYDLRHGYRGPEANWGTPVNEQTLASWSQELAKIPTVNGLMPAIILQVSNQQVTAMLADRQTVTIPWSGLHWAFKYNDNRLWGRKPKKAGDILKPGDLIRVMQSPDHTYQLAQIPQVQGALVALNPQNGAVLALLGGFDFNSSNFNRAVQAERQPGSSFKPFIYAAALAKGYTLASIINDAPVVVNDPSEQTLWRPQNDTRQFYGPTRLRVGLIESRNLVSIRLLQDISPKYAVDFAARFGFPPEKMPQSLSLALGTAMVTPLELATGYAAFANGGYKIKPYIIDRIVDANGENIYQAEPQIACVNCENLNTAEDAYPAMPGLQAPRIITPQIAYLITSALKSVIQEGTGQAAKILNRKDLAGKTGTTNQQMDAWFSGFNADIVATVWIGFDQPQSLYEYGAQAALPMWIDFMRSALKNKPEHTMAEPPGIVTVKIDPDTGLLASAGQKNAIFEIFRKEYVPAQTAPAKDNENQDNMAENWAAPLF